MNMHGGRECLNEKMLPPRSEVATQACPDPFAHDMIAALLHLHLGQQLRSGFQTVFLLVLKMTLHLISW